MDFRLLLLLLCILLNPPSFEAKVEVRLVGGRTPYEGRLEVRNRNDGQWGTVCDDRFDKNAAVVVCRMLGFQNTEHAANVSSKKYGRGLGNIFLDEVGCIGNETDLWQCSHNAWGKSDCEHTEDTGVNCQTPVRLTGGNASHSGRVEIETDGAWKTLCFDNFNETVGIVLCRMLAYSTGNVEIKSASGNQRGIVVFGKQFTCNGKENDISQCTLKEQMCNDDRRVDINCRTKLRLQGGPHNQSGRVEVFFQDKWGAVCDNAFDDNAASVICRMLGYSPKYAKAYGRSRYGAVVGDIMIDELRCLGSEIDISECKTNLWGPNNHCRPNETASVKCATEVRLADGPTAFSGRLEMRYNGIWKTVCDRDFDKKTAAVICRMLQFERGNVTVHTGAYYTKGSNGIVDYGWKCLGNETDISDCTHIKQASQCNRSEDVGINCLSTTPIRLVGGPTPFTGRVEVYMQQESIWKGVCYDSLTIRDAAVLCTMYGKPNRNPNIHIATNLYDYVIRGKAVDHLSCNGSEKDITDCRYTQPWNQTGCTYPNYAGINCDPVTSIRLVDGPSVKAGRVEILFNGTWGSICTSGVSLTDTNIMCKMLGNNKSSYILNRNEFKQTSDTIIINDLNCNGDESDISDCRASPWQTGVCLSSEALGIACTNNIRLVNGSNERSGRVEILLNGTWGTLCADSFDVNVANVVCRMAGFRFWNVSILPDSSFGRGSRDVLIDNITCKGDETDFAFCQSSPWRKTSCKSNHVATVHCRIQRTPLRLVNGETSYSGRVEVFHNDKWGTVCAADFTREDAQVVCRTILGNNNASRDLSVVVNKYSTGHIPNNVMIGNLACFGNESDISVCPSNDWDSGYDSCPYSRSYQSVGVNCMTPVQLVGGRTKYMGRVQITYNGKSGSICKENFTNGNVQVICSMLGFNFTTAYGWQNETFKTNAARSTIVEGLKCTGSEIDIKECSSRPWGQPNCSTNKAASVNCNTPVRLKDGPNLRSGRVEVLLNGTWNGMCFTGNTESDVRNGKVVCKMLGFSTGNVTVSSKSEVNNILVNMTCSGAEDDISRCKMLSETCSTSKIVEITCDTGVQLIRGRTDYMGAVSVFLHGQYGIVQYINDNVTAGVVCSILGYNFTRYSEVQTSQEFKTRSCIRTNIERLVCEGNESDVMDCRNSYWSWDSSCSYAYSGVNCQTPVRLANGSQYQYGRVEIKQDGAWYPVCSNNFTIHDAYVVCRMLGHKYVKNARITETFKEVHGNYLTGDRHCTGRELDISQCPYNSKISNCPADKPAYIDCRTTSVRLVDGPTPYKGRPELEINGKWRSICQDVDSYTYKLICKMLGFTYTGAIAHAGSRYSNKTFNSTDYAVSGLNCYQTEEDITECSSRGWNPNSSCSYSYTHPLEIECNTPVYLVGGSNPNIGRIMVNYKDTYRSICGDNFTVENADVICRKIGSETYGNATIYYGNRFGSPYTPIEGLNCKGNETDLQECESLPWTPELNQCSALNNSVAINCRPITPIRLNGTEPSSGLVELYYNNRWRTVCYSSFDVKDASVLCNMLGYKIGEVGDPVVTKRSDVLTRGLLCSGTENDISECGSSYSWNYYSTCSGSYQRKATVKCSNNRVRLVGGVNDYKGRVEFQFIGVWGTICDDFFDAKDAEVVCREIGIEEKNATIYNNTFFGRRYSSLLVQDLKCTGNELEIDKCGSYPWIANTYKCSSNQRNVGINCRPKTPIMLVNSTSKYKGRLEVEYKGSYGTVCDRDFDHEDAKVICRMLGYNTMSVEFRKHSYYGRGSGNITISNLQCTGGETDISDCYTPYRWSEPYEFCDHVDDVSVECDTPVRLRGGWTYYDGLVEIYINGSWKTVCSQGFTQDDAKAVCSITGKRKNYDSSKAIAIHQAGFYGIGDSLASVSSLGCKGSEDDLFMCDSARWTTFTNSCIAQSVAVNCRPETDVRLVNKSGVINLRGRTNDTVSGRIEVSYNNRWGTICDDQFDESDAQVLCRMLGFTVGKVYRGDDNMGEAAGSILIDDLDCLGTESDISECRSREWGIHNCEHSEDIVITCDDINNIDPCHAKEHTRLPNLEVRYANTRTVDLQSEYNDSKLPLRWYSVGNNTMPNKPPGLDHCGTKYPIYSKDRVPVLEDKTVKITAVQVGDKDVQYDILVKHCKHENSDFYVYRLSPTKNSRSGYCFGVGTTDPPPTFVPEKVSVTINDNKSLSFHCKFAPLDDEDLLYQVFWEITGNYRASFTKQYYNRNRLQELDLTDKDFEDYDVGLGVNITCAVRAFGKPNGSPGPTSSVSYPYFAGLKIANPHISLRKGEVKSIEIINTVPLICLDFLRDTACTVELEHMIPSDDKCSSKGSFQQRSCSTTLRKDSYNQITTVNITTSETGQYGVYGHFKVNLVYNPNTDLVSVRDKLWQKRYKLPTVNVEVFPEEDRSWRKTICSARNDPHMQTFNNKVYEHHDKNKGEYILYRHRTFKNVEIQHKIDSCVGTNSKAKCNCGVAVRAGRDVYVINVCDKLLDIGYKRCEDEALTVKKDNDFTYTIYLPYGTAVRARIDNQPWMGKEGGRVIDITVLPSVHDNGGMSVGLCGTHGNNTDDDFRHRNGSPGTLANITMFISSWEVKHEESLFSELNLKNMALEPWVSPSCMCQQKDERADVPTTCDRSVSECTPGMSTGEHSCGGLSSRRTRRSVSQNPSIPIVMQTSHYSRLDQHTIKKRSTTTWTKDSAEKHCKQYFDAQKAFNLCKQLPATHTNISVKNCALDITLTNDTEWMTISRQAMQDTCTTEIHRNESVREEVLANISRSSNVEHGTDIKVNPTVSHAEAEEIKELKNIKMIVQEIKEISCLNNCSQHGRCTDGICKCDKDFLGSDCSLNSKKPPRLVDALDRGHCDEKYTDCTHIYVFGEVFMGTNVSCRLRKFTFGINESVKLHNDEMVVHGRADTLIEAMCPIQHIRKKRSISNGPPSDFVFGYQVSVSNDGIHFSNETVNVYIYDSTCQSYENMTSIGMTFYLKAGYCHIEGSCVANGTLATKRTVMCDTRASNFSWTPVPTTTPATTTVQVTTTGCKSGWTGLKCDTDIDECSNKTMDMCAYKHHSSCQNKPGGYDCLCLRHFKDTDEGKCEEQTDKGPNSWIEEIVAENKDRQAFRVEIHVDIPLDSSKNLAVSKTYERYAEETKSALMQYYGQRLGISLVDIIIISLKSGSLNVEHAVIMKKDDFGLKAMSVAIADFARGAKITLFGQDYDVHDVKIEKNKANICLQYQEFLAFRTSYTHNKTEATQFPRKRPNVTMETIDTWCPFPELPLQFDFSRRRRRFSHSLKYGKIIGKINVTCYIFTLYSSASPPGHLFVRPKNWITRYFDMVNETLYAAEGVLIVRYCVQCDQQDFYRVSIEYQYIVYYHVGTETDHYQRFLLCESYIVLHPCKEHESCVLEKDTPVCRPTVKESASDKSENTLIIASSSVGSVLLIVILVLVVVICRNRRNKRSRLENHRSTADQNEYHNVNSSGMLEIPRAKVYSDSILSRQETTLDNPAYKHDERTYSESRSKPGLESRSKDGYVYYFGKK